MEFDVNDNTGTWSNNWRSSWMRCWCRGCLFDTSDDIFYFKLLSLNPAIVRAVFTGIFR